METNAVDKRRRIVDAAVRTFARKGYHNSRVSDIAKEAGVAYGLVYHYFENKEEILNSIFQEYWSVFIQVLKHIEKDKTSIRNQFESMCSFLLEAYKNNPELIEVIIIEVTRSHKFMEKQNRKLFQEAFDLLEKMIKKGRRAGAVRKNIDVTIACYMVLGAVETVLSGFVIHMLNLDDARSFNRAKQTMVDIALTGLAPGA